MISQETLSCLIWAFRFAAKIQPTSFDWDVATGKLFLKPEKLTRNKSYFLITFGAWIIGIQLINIIYRVLGIIFIVLNVVLRNDITSADVIFSFYIIAIWCLTLPTHVLFLIWDFKVVNYVNSILVLNTEFRKATFK